MTYLVLEIQEIDGTPVVVSQAMTDPSNIKEAKSLALQKAGYWTNPPVNAVVPPVVTITAITVTGRQIPGFTWDFINEPEPEPEVTPGEEETPSEP